MNKYIIVSVILTSVFSSIATKPWFCHNLDCPDFTVVQNTSDYELRHYSPSKWVATNMTASAFTRNNDLFQRLFQYISGNNIPSQKVTMTCPVLTTVKTETSGEVTLIMHFLIPHDKLSNTPLPADDRVYLVDVPAMDVYVKSFGGYAGESTYTSKVNELKASLDNLGPSLYDSSQFYTAGYDSPFAFVNRHNEVWLQKMAS